MTQYLFTTSLLFDLNSQNQAEEIQAAMNLSIWENIHQTLANNGLKLEDIPELTAVFPVTYTQAP